MQPLHVGIREAKASLSKLLKIVRQGREVVITDRGRPIGKIVPMDEGALSLEERIRRLCEQGVLVHPLARHHPTMPPPLPVAGDLAQQLLQEDRDRGTG